MSFYGNPPFFIIRVISMVDLNLDYPQTSDPKQKAL